jgi:sulfur carrier protein
MRLSVNGEARTVHDGQTVADLVAALAGPAARGVAVAVNGNVVPRSAWRETALGEGDAIEVLTAVQGG